MDNEKLQAEKQHMDWWNNLSDNEEISILKEEGIFGHDQGVTEAEIKSFYKSRVITPAPLSEQKQEGETKAEIVVRCMKALENIEHGRFLDMAYDYFSKEAFVLNAMDEYALQQSQHTAKQIEEKQRTNKYLVERIDKVEVSLLQEDIENQKLRKQVQQLKDENAVYEMMVEASKTEINRLEKEVEQIDQYKARIVELEAEILTVKNK